jgi:hypothetical protein
MMVPTYEADLAAWIDGTVPLLREKAFDTIDVDALIEKLGSLGSSERSAIENDLYQLLYHLLKLRYAPALDIERAGRQWRLSINESRRGRQRRIKRSPSLLGYPLEVLPEEYTDARRQTAEALALPLATLSEACPWGIDEILNSDFFPE